LATDLIRSGGKYIDFYSRGARFLDSSVIFPQSLCEHLQLAMTTVFSDSYSLIVAKVLEPVGSSPPPPPEQSSAERDADGDVEVMVASAPLYSS
jgi:hypothetical protein